jgi:hypothetical protein
MHRIELRPDETNGLDLRHVEQHLAIEGLASFLSECWDRHDSDWTDNHRQGDHSELESILAPSTIANISETRVAEKS